MIISFHIRPYNGLDVQRRKATMRIAIWIVSLIFLVIGQSSISIAEDDGLGAIKESYNALFLEKKYKEGLPLAIEYANKTSLKSGEQSADYAKALYNVAIFQYRLKEDRQAVQTLMKALTIAEEISPEHDEVVSALKLLIQIYKGRGKKLRTEFFESRLKAIEIKKATSDKRGSENAVSDDYIVVPVFYATDRQNTGSKNPKERYGPQISKEPKNDYLQYGIAKVSIPGGDRHKIGQLESPSVVKFEWAENPAKHVVLLEVEGADKASYFQQLKEKVATAPNQNAFIFIHGYNVTFEDAARRTAQIAYDLNFKGAPVFYSWPSRGTTFGYTKDATTVQWTEPHLENFLIDFLEKSDAQNIYVIAHSMGNRAMTRVIASVAQTRPDSVRRIKEIILAAPDIDAEVFKGTIAPRMIDKFTNITLYASSKDLALMASKMFWGYPRAGDAGEALVVIPGVETIDATFVDSSLLGHSYIGGSETLLSDLVEIFKSGKRASKRQKLKQKTYNNLPYWVFE